MEFKKRFKRGGKRDSVHVFAFAEGWFLGGEPELRWLSDQRGPFACQDDVMKDLNFVVSNPRTNISRFGKDP